MVAEKKYSPIITEIHNLFNTASENLLNEAEVILKEYELAEMFSIKSLPTIIICGKETMQFTGLTSKPKIETFLKSKIDILV